MREISLDTETTGLSPKSGDRVVEIGCVEMLNHVPTGEVFHVYINPKRDMPDGAFKVHGLSEAFLKEHPVFADVVDGFLNFIGDDKLVIHNASFDMGFLNAELDRLNLDPLPMSQSIDTVRMARKKFPGAQASLDALCRRFGIDNSNRELHGALLDAQLLADVYLELMGGRQTGFGLDVEAPAPENADSGTGKQSTKQKKRDARDFQPSSAELTRHAAFLENVTDPIWKI